MAKIRIAVLGIGGVGGYFGGLLADEYASSEDIEIIFIGRKRTVDIINEKGLKLITPQYEKIIRPTLAASDPSVIGPIDLLISATKSYDLEDSLLPLKDCITDSTSILPLLNGVDSKERIKKIFPKTDVWDGCVYIVSRLLEPGIVKETGNIHSLYFGSVDSPSDKLKRFEKTFRDAGIEAFLSENIEQVTWEKFLFISTIASLTSYLDKTIGAILADEGHRKTLKELFNELALVAAAKKIKLTEGIIEKQISRMERLPYETTSSMHSDFQKGGRTEYHSLTEYVVALGKELNVSTPVYSLILSSLSKRSR